MALLQLSGKIAKSEIAVPIFVSVKPLDIFN